MSLFNKYLPDILDFSLKCLSAFNIYKMQRKEEPEDITEQRNNCMNLIKSLSKLQELPVEKASEMGAFFDSEVERIFNPFKEMADLARNWFEEEKVRQEERKIEEAKWKEEYEKEEAIKTKIRREENKKAEAAQQKMAEAMLVMEEKKQLMEEKMKRR